MIRFSLRLNNALTLPTYYIADGARLLYPGAPGLALVWGVVVVALGQVVGRKTRPWIAPLVTVSLALLLMWQGATFVRGMVSSYEMASAPTTAVVEHFATTPTAENHAVVLVNWPQWLAPPRNTFALGTEFAPVLGDHLFAAELLRVNVGQNGVERPVYNLVVPDLLQETPYHYGVYRFTAVDQLPPPISAVPQQSVFITTYTEAGPVGQHTGDLLASPPPPTLLATLGPWQLHAAQACFTEGVVQTSLTLSLPDPAALPPTASFFVQLLGTDGRLLAQADGPALGLAPERFAELGGVVLVDRRELAVPAGAEPGMVLLGVYDYVSGERLPVLVEGNTAVVDNALHLPVTACD